MLFDLIALNQREFLPKVLDIEKGGQVNSPLPLGAPWAGSGRAGSGEGTLSGAKVFETRGSRGLGCAVSAASEARALTGKGKGIAEPSRGGGAVQRFL